MKIKDFDFEFKRKLMISINNEIIAEKFDENCINRFDSIFSNTSYEEVEYDAYLYRLWNDIKGLIKKYYKKNKDLLNNFLEFINIQLCSLTIDDRKKIGFIKIKDGNYGKK